MFRGTESSVRPAPVVAYQRPDGITSVRMANDIREEDRDGQTIYVYDEAVFDLGADRTETAADIEAAFDGWWLYGTQPDEAPMTLEERIEIIEEILTGGEI